MPQYQEYLSTNLKDYSKEEELEVAKTAGTENVELQKKGEDDDDPNPTMWSFETEDIACAIGDYAKCMGRLCIFTSEYYQSQRTYLLVPAAVLSWGLNIFGIIVTYVGNARISDSLVIMINSLFNFIIATFTTVAEKSNAGSKVELFQQIAKDYYSLANMITQEMTRHPKDRIAVKSFLSLADSTYKELEKSTPPIPRYIVEAFIQDNRGTKLSQKRDMWEQMRKPYILSYLTPTDYSRHRSIKSELEEDISDRLTSRQKNRLEYLERENTRLQLRVEQLEESECGDVDAVSDSTAPITSYDPYP